MSWISMAHFPVLHRSRTKEHCIKTNPRPGVYNAGLFLLACRVNTCYFKATIDKLMRIHCFHVILACCLSLCAAGQERIALNQDGFYPMGPKLAFVTGHLPGGPFYVLTENRADTVFKGILGPETASRNSATVTRKADFSGLQQEGRYVVSIPGVGVSYAFPVKAHAMEAASIAALKGYYYLRSNMPLEAAYAGQWQRPAGHPDTAVLVHASAADVRRPEGTVLASPGGWYDAGDYNKYVVNSGISVYTLLAAYEDFKPYYDTLHTGIPESSNRLPDILDEALYNLRWMLTMQDPQDGGVYHKLTNAAFDGWVKPGATTLPRYVVQKSTAATLDLAAVAAQAARVFSAFEKQAPGLADSCRRAAIAAWGWAQAHPAVLYDQDVLNKKFAPAISTGTYGDHHVEDEWFWAACELYATTKEKAYRQALEKRITLPVSVPDWGHVQLLGYYTLLRTGVLDSPALKDSLLRLADGYVNAVQHTAFATAMGGSTKDFIWGSNAVAANQGMLLLVAYRLTHAPRYAMAALDNLDYLLGRNATGYCFVTGQGSFATMHPHHRPSVSDGIAAPVPGLLAGGPNPGMQDHVHYTYAAPELAYMDDAQSYASNEIAINWNAPLVYLCGGIEALQQELGLAR